MHDGRFPIQNGCGTVPWSAAERAYKTYSSRYGTDQSLERLAERGGFGLEEFCLFYNGISDMNRARFKERLYPLIVKTAIALGRQWQIPSGLRSEQ